jgi:hypothetical protein
LLHEGQTIDDAGNLQGDAPQTDTLGFRWSAVNNLFLTAGSITMGNFGGFAEVGQAQ